jgi:two-component system phosphate regulon sensor histidine kinase PhoR
MSLFGSLGHRRSVSSEKGRSPSSATEQIGEAADVALAAREGALLMDICGAAVLVLDSRGAVIDANLAARQLFIASAPLIGKTLLEVTLSASIQALWKSCLAGEAVRGVEVEGLSANATFVVSMGAVQGSGEGDAGQIGRVLVVIRDISELRRLETIRRDFVANVSHELRTPLASIRAMAETLQDGALEDASVARRFLGTIVTETERLSRIAADLLALSDAESQRPETELFDLAHLLRDVVNRSQPQAERASLRLASDIAGGLVVMANPDQMEQVIVNLLDNALKYTPAGGSVQVVATVEGDHAVIQVRDTGIGILSTDLPRIFERFYRVDKARSRQSGGTGLGLAIVKHIVEAHSGRVTVESEYNHGSTFTITLPVCWEEEDRPAIAADERPQQGSGKKDNADDTIDF